MRIIRTYSIFLTGILVAFLSTSCIKSYEPEIVANDVSKYVVSGQVNNGDTIQRVNISTSSAVSESKYFPVTGCTVIIMDDKGNSYTGSDKQDGNYEFVIPQSELVPGTRSESRYSPGGPPRTGQSRAGFRGKVDRNRDRGNAA